MLFRKPRDEFKRYASHVQGLHGLLRPAQVDQDVNEDKVDDHGQWSMVMVMIMMILGCRVSADAAQLLATKFSSSTCGSGFTYTAGRLFRFDYQYVCTQCDYEDPQSIEVNCSKWPHVDRGEEKLLFRIPLFWP